MLYVLCATFLSTDCKCTTAIYYTVLALVLSLQSTDIEALRPDAFLVVYSVSDRKSFDTAVEVLRYLRCDLGTDRTVNLVANKMDLRRQQRVTAKGQCSYKIIALAILDFVFLHYNFFLILERRRIA